MTWTLDDVIDAHGLDYRRANALKFIVTFTSEIAKGMDAIYDIRHWITTAQDNLRRIVANDGLLMDCASCCPLDPDRAAEMTPEAIAANFDITHPCLIDAIARMIPSNVLSRTVAQTRIDLEAAIAELGAYISYAQIGAERRPGDGSTIPHVRLILVAL